MYSYIPRVTCTKRVRDARLTHYAPGADDEIDFGRDRRRGSSEDVQPLITAGL